MKIFNKIFKFSTVVLVLTLLFCSKKSGTQRTVIISNDTLSVADIRKSLEYKDSIDFSKELLILAISNVEAPVEQDSLFIADLKERLELQSQRTFTLKECSKLFGITLFLDKKITNNIDSINGLIKSIRTRIIAGDLLDLFSPYQDELKNKPEDNLKNVLVKYFVNDIRVATVLVDFLAFSLERAGLNGENSDEIKSMVAGLLYDSTANTHKKRKNKKTNNNKQSKMGNTAEILKYRSMKSIKESISEHTATVQAIYKKTLKLNDGIRGTVSVKFIVLPSGKVDIAKITKSDIKNREFIETFLNYVESINFKPVPEKIGNMSFIFPFEFTTQ